jgi:hypothetical protein
LKTGEGVGRDFAPNLQALLTNGFVELKVLALECRDERLERGVGVRTSQ